MPGTVFFADRSIAFRNGCWQMNVTIRFEGMEFPLNDEPVPIEEKDIPDIRRRADEDGRMDFSDTVPIRNRFQFSSIFGDSLTEKASDILLRTYRPRTWLMKVRDTSGREVSSRSCITEEFFRTSRRLLRSFDRFWMEIVSSEGAMRSDWSVESRNEKTVYSNMTDGVPPIYPETAERIVDSLIPDRMFTAREEFDAYVLRSDNSLVLKVSEQCMHMGLKEGDRVHVILSRNDEHDNSDLRVLSVPGCRPLMFPEDLCENEDCDSDIAEKFLTDFGIAGRVHCVSFPPAEDPESKELFRHAIFLRDGNGGNMVVSQPDRVRVSFRQAAEWAERHGCTTEEFPEYSWHRPPQTTLLVFRRKKRNDWRIPEKTFEKRC